MMLSGITTVGEFHYLHHRPGGAPYADPDAMTEALVAAARTAGIRMSVIDTCYLTGGIGQPLAGTQARFGDGSVERWIQRVERLAPSEQVRLCAGVHSVRALLPEDIEGVANFARKHSIPLHFHLSEQQQENEQCLAAYGRTPTELLEDCGALDAASVAVHATFVSESDIERLGSAGTSVCLCPSTEQELGDGVAPADALRRAGSPLCVGSDSNAVDRSVLRGRGRSNSVSALLAADAPSPLRSRCSRRRPRTAHGPSAGPKLARSLLALAATSSHSTPRSVRLAGAMEADPVTAVVFAASAADVTDVVVDGRTVVEQRHHVACEEPGAALSRAIDALRRRA